MAAVPILYVIPRMSLGGAQVHLLEVLRRLDRRRFAPRLCYLTLGHGDPGHLLEQVRELGVPLIAAGLRNASNALVQPHTLLQMLRVAGILRQQRILIVHSYLFHANWFGTLTARLARVPVVIISKRNVDVYTRRRDRWACRVVNRLAHCVTAVAQTVRDHVHQSEGCPLAKMVVIPNGVALHQGQGHAAETAKQATLGWGPEAKVIGTISRLVWYKGHSDLLQAAAIVVRRYPAARFLLIGDGPLRQPLEEQARALGLHEHVRFLGAQPDAASLLPSVEIFAVPSLWEGMSNSLLEAMAAGKPVVATTVGGNAEVVLDEQTGLLVPPQNHEALAEAILRLLVDPELARQMGEAARQRVESAFTLETMVGYLEDLYSNLLAKRSVRA